MTRLVYLGILFSKKKKEQGKELKPLLFLFLQCLFFYIKEIQHWTLLQVVVFSFVQVAERQVLLSQKTCRRHLPCDTSKHGPHEEGTLDRGEKKKDVLYQNRLHMLAREHIGSPPLRQDGKKTKRKEKKKRELRKWRSHDVK